MDRVFELIKVVFPHFWPQEQNPSSSHRNIQSLFKRLRVESDLLTIQRTFNRLLSFADPKALTKYRTEKPGLEGDIWHNAIQGAMDQDDSLDFMIRVIESGLGNVSYDIFLDFYSSCAEDLGSGGLIQGISGRPLIGAQCM